MKFSVAQVYLSFGGKENDWFLRKLTDWKKYQLARKKRKILRKKGIKILNAFHASCSQANVKGWVAFGTLLGAYREKGFIAHDFDLDVEIMSTDYGNKLVSALKKNGFVFDHRFQLVDRQTGERRIVEETFKYDDFSIDIFISYPDVKVRNTYVMVIDKGLPQNERYVNTYAFPLVSKVEEVTINGVSYNAPSEVETCLREVYGENFMTPDPMWQTASNENKFVHRLDYSKYYGLVEK